MRVVFPFKIKPRTFLRQYWTKAAFSYLAEFFGKAQFDQNLKAVPGFSIEDYRNGGGGSSTAGTGVWLLPCGGGTASAEYSSFFKVYDASVSGTVSVGVTDGGETSPTNCGAVKINGDYVTVPVFSHELSAAGTYRVWLHMWIAAADDSPWVEGANAEIIVGAAGSETPPSNTHGGLAYSNQLLGRVTVVNNDGQLSMSTPVQDYLRGGEHIEYLWGNCSGASVEPPA